VKLISFGSYSIPQALGEWTMPIAALAGAQSILAAAGVWDDLGDLVLIGDRQISAKFSVNATTWAAAETALDALRAALFAQRDYLNVATGNDAVATRRALARCISLDVPYSFSTPRNVICSAKFELLQPHWDAITLSSLSPSTGSFSVDNTGSTCDTQRTLVIRLNGPLSANWTLTNSTNGMSFQFAGATHNIAAGHYVDVDCGALTVHYDGSTDVWEYLTLGTNQIGFMALKPGSNSFIQSGATLTLGFTWRKSYL
jgi:hypothetical protein